jgi:hypothetical protein
MNTSELLKFYDAKEKAAIEILGNDLEYLREKLKNAKSERLKKSLVNQIQVQRRKMLEAAERRTLIELALEEIKCN